MQWKPPKNTDKYYWTEHVQMKMRYYGLSQQKILGVINRPKRIETGIVENTVAVMVPTGTIKKAHIQGKSSFASDKASADTWNQEIWVMYQISNQQSAGSNQDKFKNNPALRKLQEAIVTKKKLKIISAWRYPGVSSKKDPIPAEILRELEELGI